jgi:sugar lactone lactonase YvrE
MTDQAEFDVLLEGLTFPEGPRWHDGKLWFSDFYSHRVITVDLDGNAETVIEVPNQPSGLGWTPDGRLLVVSMLDHRLMRLDPDGLTEVADMSAYARVASNDMVVDTQGRAYVGNFGFELPVPSDDAAEGTNLVRVDPDGSVSVACADMMFPNGTVITDDGKIMIIGESFAGRLTAFDIGPDGTLTNRRVFAELDPFFPDGICLDAEGAIWASDPRANKLLRIFEGSRVDREISTGEDKAVACALGGADRKTLLVCTNQAVGLAAATAMAGRIVAIPVDVPGAGLP